MLYKTVTVIACVLALAIGPASAASRGTSHSTKGKSSAAGTDQEIASHGRSLGQTIKQEEHVAGLVAATRCSTTRPARPRRRRDPGARARRSPATPFS